MHAELPTSEQIGVTLQGFIATFDISRHYWRKLELAQVSTTSEIL